MLRDLTIQGYRCFGDFSVDGLARVNLIVGANNSGKTSFLEAVYLLVNQGTPLCLLELLHDRGEVLVSSGFPSEFEYPVEHIFRDHLPQPNLKMPVPEAIIGLQSQRESPLSLHIRMSPTVATSFSEQQIAALSGVVEPRVLPNELLFAYGAKSREQILSPAGFSLKLPVSRDFTVPARPVRPVDGINPYRRVPTNGLDVAYLAELWDGITLTPREEQVVAALQIMEPAVERISFTSHQASSAGILVKLGEQSAPVPLSSMGEGLQRVLALVTSAVMSESGVLLVDEIDTGLYHGIQADVWRLLIETAQRLNVQIFATTHSWGCIVALQEALSQQDNEEVGRLFRLEQFAGDIRAVTYSNDELEVAVRHAIEVR